MKFTCPKCDTRYTLADDKIPPAPVLRFTCKKCNNVIRVRRKDGSIEDSPAGSDEGAESTRVASLAEINATAQASAQARAAEWYVLIGGAQRGPYLEAQLQELLAQGQIDERTYVWREGLGEWQRLGKTSELSLSPAAQAPTPTVMMSKSQLQAEIDKMKPPPRRSAAIAPSMSATGEIVLPRGTTPPAGAGGVFGALLSEASVEPVSPESLSPFEPSAPAAPPAAAFDEEPAPALPQAAAQAAQDESYLDAPPGESTKVYLSTAGLYRRQRNNRIAAAVASGALVLLVGVISLDLSGVYTIPGMGLVYDVTGMRDPNLDRAVARVESQLEDSTLPKEERDALRNELLGLQQKRSPQRSQGGAAMEGGAGKKTAGVDERALAADIFADDRKKEAGLQLVAQSEIQTPSLPAGLTQEAIYKVINDNARSMKLCLEEAFKKGDKLTGKMEVQMTIAPSGAVSDAQVVTAQFRNAAIGSCTMRRVKGWKFPRWNGEPVTVVFPYVLSAGF